MIAGKCANAQETRPKESVTVPELYKLYILPLLCSKIPGNTQAMSVGY